MWSFSNFKDNLAIIDDCGVTLTYAQLKEESEKIARAALSTLNSCAALSTSNYGAAFSTLNKTSAAGKRCLVFVLCGNETGAIMGYTGFINAKIVPVLLNKRIDRALLENLLEAYSPSFIWLPEALAEKCETLNSGRAWENFELIYKSYNYALLKTNYKTEYELYPELGLLLTTSGSTGSPKFVRQSYENILNNAQAIAEYLELNENERPVLDLPMNYTYGLSVINSHLLVGATLLVTEKSLMQREFWSFIKENKASSISGVPYTYEMLDKMRFQRMKLPDLRTMTQAGGKLTPELHKKFAEFAVNNNKKFIVMYGACEATARMGYLPAEKSLEKYGSMGIAIPGGKFYLINDSGEKITQPHVTGELVYEGKNVTLGYAECGADLAKGDERNGVLFTGDMAQFDDDGYYYIVGRKKRFLKMFGNRVNLDEIDRLIKAEFGIECASAGVDDKLYIFILKLNENISAQIRDFISQKTHINPSGFNIVALDEIPKNDSGKVLYTELAKYYDIEA